MRKFSALSCVLLTQVAAQATAQTDLEQGFKNPPQSAKAHTWWHWINGNISKPGITKDLEAMKRFGLGGAQIFNVDVGIPAGDTPFMGDRWKDAIAWAFKEAKRLGLELDIHNGAGWSSSGGPWVTPRHAMQFLTWSETPVHGPLHFSGTLKEPPKKLNFYEDITCYVVRKPANDSFRIANIRAKAAFDRGDRIDPDPSAVPANSATALTDIKQITLGPGGKATIDLPAGDWILIRLGHTPTGAQNEPSPAPGLGSEVDKLSREALDEFWSGMMATAVKANGPVTKSGLIGALIDSYEVGSQNWTPKFREEFMKRRGYDPMPYLVSVTGRVVQSGEVTERFLWDLRKTVCDLFADNYYGYMAELCHRNGLKFSTEGYGNGSFDNLQISGIPDIPMAEFWIGGLATETTKMVASSAHTYGKPVIGAEAFTADDQHAKWLYDPYSIKALGDKMFCLGINRYIFHRYAHQPWLDLEPGMTMGPWGTNFDRTITWWDQGRAWMEYVARCQFMLQSGRFVADVLVFEGDDAPNDLPMMGGKEVPEGYDYDGCDAKVLMSARVENRQIVLPSGMRYRLLLLSKTPYMTVATMRKIDELARAGAVIVGKPPVKSPSLAEAGEGDKIVADLAGQVWNGSYSPAKFFSNQPLDQALRGLRVQRDLESTGPVNWIHRLDGSNDIYFVANPAYRPIDLEVTFHVDGKQPEIWNPETGTMETALVWRSQGKSTTVPLRLEAAGSVFVVFRSPAPQSHLTAIKWLGANDAEPEPPVIQIVSARYEATDGSGGVDVTEKVKSIVRSGETSVVANNGNFGDPTYNHVKRLHIIFTIDSTRTEKNIAENDTLEFVPAGPDDALPTTTLSDGDLLFWRPGKVEISSPGQTEWISSAPFETLMSRPWTLTFPPGKGAPASAILPTLSSWSDSSVEGIRHFSGTASYHTTFHLPDQGPGLLIESSYRTGSGTTVSSKNYVKGVYWLDLGRVKNFAEVTLNGHQLPTLWKAPFRIDVTKWLKPGDNDLEVKVTNLWPNRLIGDEQYPAEAVYKGPIQAWPDWIKHGTPRPPTKRITFTTWQFFQKDSPLLESGLMGPVKLLRVPTFTIH